MTVDAVIFDWGGTLTPWHTIDNAELWRLVCEPHYPDDHADRAAAAHEAEIALWELARAEHRSSTIFGVLERAGIEPTDQLIAHLPAGMGAAHLHRPGRRRGPAAAARARHQDRRALQHDVAARLARGRVPQGRRARPDRRRRVLQRDRLDQAASRGISRRDGGGRSQPTRDAASSSATGRGTTFTARSKWACGPCSFPTPTFRPLPTPLLTP